MRRGMRDFFRRKQYTIAAGCVAAALLGAAGIYAFAGREKTPEEPNQQVAQVDTEEKKTETAKNSEKDTEEETKSASAVIKPARNNQQEKFDWEKEESLPEIAKKDTEEEPEEVMEEPEETIETSANVNSSRELHFNADVGLSWPVSGAVILNYSMDKTVYFSTLDQYKYNPAVIIAGNVNEKVQAAADGTIIDISTNEVTGCTVTMDLGDGYTAVYGQLKEVPYNAGAFVEAGSTIGFVNEPTKYYSLEGSNLYFELLKDGTPIDPVEYFSAE